MSQTGLPNRFHRPEGSGACNMNERICLVVNPMAGAGRAGRRLDELKAAADRAFAQWEVRETEGPGHARSLAANAVQDGFELVAAVGGDGTAHEVVGGLMDGDLPRSRKVAFCLVPFGTGSDLVKTLRIPRVLTEALWMAATGISLPTDIGRVRLQGPEGPIEEVFVNVAGFGAQGEVVRLANTMNKRLGGRLVFLSATLRTALSYATREVRLSWRDPDGERSWEGRLLSCFVANGSYCGGGMWVGPRGTMHDGLLDVTILPPLGVAQQLLNARRLYDGTVDRFPGAVHVQTPELHAAVVQGPGVSIDLDGESPGHLDATFRLLPRALHIRGGWVHNPLLDDLRER